MTKSKSFKDVQDEQNPIIKELERQLREKDKIISDIQLNSGQLDLLMKTIISHVSSVDPVPILYNPKKESSSRAVTPVFQDTDWHIGEVQNADEIEQINEYNYSIAQSRIKDLTGRENRIVDRFRSAYSIKNGVIICTGDMISGNLREESNRTNEFSEPVQVVKAAELFASRTIGLAQNFDKLTIEYVTADNHSRLTKKPESKDQGINSFNYLVAVIAQKILSRQSNIEFNIHTEPQKVIAVLNRRYLCMHGHQIRGWAGIPWYGVERKVGKESQSRLSMIMDDPTKLLSLGFNKIVAGHLHTPINTMYYSVGGSLSGTNAYDRENGRYSPPSQPMWFVDPKYGEFGRIDFNL